MPLRISQIFKGIKSLRISNTCVENPNGRSTTGRHYDYTEDVTTNKQAPVIKRVISSIITKLGITAAQTRLIQDKTSQKAEQWKDSLTCSFKLFDCIFQK